MFMCHSKALLHAMVQAKRAGINFGAFHETPRTLWRPRVGAFDPHHAWTEEMHETARQIERSDHELARQPHVTTGLAQRLRRETLARNAYATASIEGNPLTLSQVESLLDQPSPASAREPDEIEILNYASFMSGSDATRAPRSPQDVLGIHAALFRGVLKDAGRWKRSPNFIGSRATREVIYVPAAPERVIPELRNAIDWLHDATSVPPLVRVLLFHHEFESIHPFRDGNGRAGRAITPMALQEFGYVGCAFAPIDLVIHQRRAEYYRELAVVERNGSTDHTPWLAFMLNVVRSAYESGLADALFQNALPVALAARPRQMAEWFASLASQKPDARVKFNDVHHAFPQVAERTLKRDLALLRDEGILEVEGVLKGTTYRLAPSMARRS